MGRVPYVEECESRAGMHFKRHILEGKMLMVLTGCGWLDCVWSLNPSALHIQVVKVPHAALHFIALIFASLLNVHHFQRVSGELLDIGGEDYVCLFF